MSPLGVTFFRQIKPDGPVCSSECPELAAGCTPSRVHCSTRPECQGVPAPVSAAARVPSGPTNGLLLHSPERSGGAVSTTSTRTPSGPVHGLWLCPAPRTRIGALGPKSGARSTRPRGACRSWSVGVQCRGTARAGACGASGRSGMAEMTSSGPSCVDPVTLPLVTAVPAPTGILSRRLGPQVSKFLTGGCPQCGRTSARYFLPWSTLRVNTCNTPALYSDISQPQCQSYPTSRRPCVEMARARVNVT